MVRGLIIVRLMKNTAAAVLGPSRTLRVCAGIRSRAPHAHAGDRHGHRALSSIDAAKAAIDSARARTMQSNADRLPQVSGQAGYTYNFPAPLRGLLYPRDGRRLVL